MGSQPRFKDEMISRAAPLLLAALAALTYGVTATAIASTRSLWVDEVLAVWAARLPRASDVVDAIWNGAEFSPPTYDLFLHTLFHAAGSDPLTARLPSIVAVLLTACLIGYMLEKRLGSPFGALAFALTLNSALFNYAIQARAYAALTTLLAAALVLWIDRAEPVKPARAIGIALCLFASVSLHYYAVVTFAVFGLMEALWSLAHRRLRPAMWIAFAAGAAPCALWLPLLRRHASLNVGDVNSPEFYAAPTLAKLAEHVQTLFIGPAENRLFMLAAILILAAVFAYASIGGAEATRRETTGEGETNLLVAGVGLLAALPIAFLLALTFTHAFSARYALASSLGLVIVFTLAISRSPYRNQVAYALLAFLCVLPLLRGGPGDLSATSARLLKAHPAQGPIVIGDGNFFMEMMESSEPSIRARLVYLKRPAGVVDGDTSAEHQLLRLKDSFRPDLPVRDFESFARENPAFAAFARPGKATDVLSAWLVEKGWVSGVYSLQPAIALIQVRALQR